MSVEGRVSRGETGCADAWRVVDFERPKLPENLQPLITDKFGLSDLLTELERYNGVLRNSCSIACNRGATLRTPRLCAQLESIFSTPEPQTSASSRPLTWARLIRHVESPGANLPDTVLTIKDIVAQLPEDDRKPSVTGRPWQFFKPRPDENDLGAELKLIESTVAELSNVSERVNQAARGIDTLKEELLRRHNRLVLLQSQQYSPSGPVNPYSTNPTIGTAIQSTGWQDGTKQSKNMEPPNNSSSQHAQSLSETYGSPPNAARRLKVIDLIDISNQHAQSAPYATASPNAVVQSKDLKPVENPSQQHSQCPTGPSTPSVSHAPSSACTSNTDAMYSLTATEEQASPNSTASYYVAEETSELRQPHLELQVQASPQCEGTGACDQPTSFLHTLRR
ncbi:hypothetical protein AnigIFM63604_007421 [Aspergillus niger]|uniref:Uncharacterized protein n=1 Tax=Aspergillus niger TaxID=5061 RepID=A0A3F3RN52_ASPNG|nr:hypothetical protein AnigIFM63604_007421 [Aspergillus niger]SPB49517.1 unnamed protein product [Aspergillus niger]